MTRYVITGGASCGKTSVINELKRRGYEVVRETARDIITKRYTNEVDEKEMLKRQKLIFHDQIIREDNLEKGLVFLDRGLIDVLAYSRLFLKKIPKNILNHRYSKRYSGVFVLERLSLEKDGLRFEKEDCEVEKIYREIIRAYEDYGYKLIFVPILTISERVEYIIKNLKGGI